MQLVMNMRENYNFHKEHAKSFSDFLLLNAHSLSWPGLAKGKASVALALGDSREILR